MTREELIQAIAEAEKISEEEVDAVVDQFLDLIRGRMAEQNETSIYGFGKFGVRWWKGRSGRDPQTGEEIEIEGRWMPYWTPSDTLIEEGKPHPKEQTVISNKEPEKETKPDNQEKGIEERAPKETEDKEPVSTPPQPEEEKPEPDKTQTEWTEEEPVRPEPSPEPHQSPAPSYTPHYMRSQQSSSSRKWLITLGAIITIIVLAFIAFGFLGEHSEEMAENTTTESTIKSEDGTQNANAGAPTQPLSSETTPVKGSSANTNMADGTSSADISPARSASHSQEQFFENYQSALDQFRDRNYSAAKERFQQLLGENPPVDYMDNVQYWLGESEFALGEYDQAITSFGKVFRYPNTNKMDDAMLMMSYAYRQLGEYDQARLLLLRFRHQYSNSPYANVAEKWLRNDSLKLVKSP